MTPWYVVGRIRPRLSRIAGGYFSKRGALYISSPTEVYSVTALTDKEPLIKRTVALFASDLDKAKKFASEAGISTQEWLRNVLRDAIAARLKKGRVR